MRALREWEPIRAIDRFSILSIPATFAVVFLVSLWLQPDPHGFGTHRQLGMPPCNFQSFFHIPCPTCGMTTSFSLMAHGRPLDAFLCQPAGALLFLACAVGSLACLGCFVYGKAPRNFGRLFEHKLFWAAAVVILLLGWAYKIAVTL
jgi:hypothetical protein